MVPFSWLSSVCVCVSARVRTRVCACVVYSLTKCTNISDSSGSRRQLFDFRVLSTTVLRSGSDSRTLGRLDYHDLKVKSDFNLLVFSVTIFKVRFRLRLPSPFNYRVELLSVRPSFVRREEVRK